MSNYCSGITAATLAEACRELLPEADCEELAKMALEEGLGYAFTLLIENEVEDPEEFLISKGILKIRAPR